jgi:hypothetical protein
VFGETLGPLQLLGGTLVLTAVVVLSARRDSMRAHRVTATYGPVDSHRRKAAVSGVRASG